MMGVGDARERVSFLERELSGVQGSRAEGVLNGTEPTSSSSGVYMCVYLCIYVCGL